MPARNQFRLAHMILHEMVHVVQIRHEGAPVTSIAAHSGHYETPAYRWEHAFSDADKSLFHSDSWKQLKLPCSSLQQSENPNRGQAEFSFAIVLDGSNSMNENNRMKTTKDALISLLDSGFPPGSEVGMVVFLDCGSITWHDFTMAPASLRPIVEGVTPTGSTPLARSITLAGEHLQKASGSEKKLILATDGKETCGGDPVSAASALQQVQVGSAARPSAMTYAPANCSYNPLAVEEPPSSNRVMNVLYQQSQPAKAGGITVDVLGIDVDDESQLRAIASAGGGKYYSASNLSDIAKALDQSVQTVTAVPVGPELTIGSEPTFSVGLAIMLTVALFVLIVTGCYALWATRPSRRLARAAYFSAGAGPYPLAAGRCPNPRCGQMIRPGMRFCGGCGMRIG
jgi:hypothetical protein